MIIPYLSQINFFFFFFFYYQRRRNRRCNRSARQRNAETAGAKVSFRLRGNMPGLLLVPRHNLSTYGRRAFSVAGPAAWNCLCDELREPLLTANSFRQLLKTRLFAEY